MPWTVKPPGLLALAKLQEVTIRLLQLHLKLKLLGTLQQQAASLKEEVAEGSNARVEPVGIPASINTNGISNTGTNHIDGG
jgi:hypothetical protein